MTISQDSLCENWPWMWRSLRASALAFSAAALLRLMLRAVPSMNSCTAQSVNCQEAALQAQEAAGAHWPHHLLQCCLPQQEEEMAQLASRHLA